MQEFRGDLTELTGSDLHAFLDAKDVSLACKECGQDDIIISADGADEPLHVFAMLAHDPPYKRGTYTALFAALCQNCGNVRTFAAYKVLEWKQSQEPAGE